MTAREPQNAVELLAKSYEQTRDPEMREFFELRLKHAVVERDLQLLETEIETYRGSLRISRHIRVAGLGRRALGTCSADPFGDRYILTTRPRL